MENSWSSVKSNTRSFEELPRRLFLDSSTVQALYSYGEYIWDGGEIPKDDRIYFIPKGLENIDALESIFFVNRRANFEFALSQNGLMEISELGDASYLKWGFELFDHWIENLNYYRQPPFDGQGVNRAKKLTLAVFGYLSKKDNILIHDAVVLECQAFLTMDRHLTMNASHIEKELGIEVMMPLEYWKMLRPWASLYV